MNYLDSDNVAFSLVSFEGPDPWSMVGGLGVRVRELSELLVSLGYETEVYFVGDPEKPQSETTPSGVHLFRAAQQESRLLGGGVYHGELDKLTSFRDEIKPVLIQRIQERAKQEQVTIVLAEDWQTTATVIELRKEIEALGLQRYCFIVWNANNTFGFPSINWKALKDAAQITTVSRYMKNLMNLHGLSPLVIPNGVPDRWLGRHRTLDATALKKDNSRLLLTKVARYHDDKRWKEALEALASFKQEGFKPLLIARGSSEPYREELRAYAAELGLNWSVLSSPPSSLEDLGDYLDEQTEEDIIELRFFVPEDLLQGLFLGSDLVLAYSRHEPFGIVGLEVMAMRGIAVLGGTGEDYAVNFLNSIIVDTDDAVELVTLYRQLIQEPLLKKALREQGFYTARKYLWSNVVHELFRKLVYIANKWRVDVSLAELTR